LLIRESAAAVIITAQLVLRDESQLFSLLDGLPDDKKNLLTYLFERHDARTISPSTSEGDTTIGGNQDKRFEKLSKELSRLDRRMSTPPRGHVP
jgi:CLIP-associating protein 1/2